MKVTYISVVSTYEGTKGEVFMRGDSVIGIGVSVLVYFAKRRTNKDESNFDFFYW